MNPHIDNQASIISNINAAAAAGTVTSIQYYYNNLLKNSSVLHTLKFAKPLLSINNVYYRNYLVDAGGNGSFPSGRTAIMDLTYTDSTNELIIINTHKLHNIRVVVIPL